MLAEPCEKIKRSYFTAEGIIIAAGLFLRATLALLNNRANDDHLEVSRYFLQYSVTKTFPPEFLSCWECYHPKLYHYLCFLLISLFDLNQYQQVIAAQLVNVAAGFITCIVIFYFLKEQAISPSLRRLVLAMVVFNPKLVAINVQFTNDSLAIMFGVLFSFWLWRFLKTPSFSAGALWLFFLFFALLTKGNGLVLVILAAVAMVVHLFRSFAGGRPALPYLLGSFGLLVVLACATLVPLSLADYRGYVERTSRTHSLAAVNFDSQPHPDFFTRSYVGRPGVISIFDSYLTFRFFDLLETPYIPMDSEPYPMHRTSLWSQVFARYHFSYFDQWPWVRRDNVTMWLGRAALLLGLLPTLIFVIGFFSEWLGVMTGLFSKRDHSIWSEARWMFPILTTGFLAMLILFTLEHRGFESMKAIYIMPGFLGLVSAYVSGWRSCTAFVHNRTYLKRVAYGAQWVLVGCYVANSLMLLQQLCAEHGFSL